MDIIRFEFSLLLKNRSSKQMNPNSTTYYSSCFQIRDLIKTGRMHVLKGLSLSDVLYCSFHYTQFVRSS